MYVEEKIKYRVLYYLQFQASTAPPHPTIRGNCCLPFILNLAAHENHLEELYKIPVSGPHPNPLSQMLWGVGLSISIL